MPRWCRSARRAWYLAMLVALGVVLAATSAGAATSLDVVRSEGANRVELRASAAGFARFDLDGKGRLQGGFAIRYATRTILLLDARGRRYQVLPLEAGLQRLRAIRSLVNRGSVYAPVPPPRLLARERLSRTRLTRVIRGVATRASISRIGSTRTRLWIARDLPSPPPDVLAAIRELVSPTAATTTGVVALRVEARRGRRWVTVSRAARVRTRPLSVRAFAAPRGFHRAVLVPPLSALQTPRHRSLGSVPATVTRGSTYFPVMTHQSVVAVYWGRMFASSPTLVASLNASFNVILKNPYVAPLAQYNGIGQGRLAASTVINSDPPAVVGNADVQGGAAVAPMVYLARNLPGAQRWWARWDTEQPLYVVFVPGSLVNGDGNCGYHSALPVESALIDPFGFAVWPVVPYALVKVPPFSSISCGGGGESATVTLSHETVEAATDPLLGGWRQPSPPSGEQGEVSDICQEGATAPFAQLSRVGGVAVNTYWSQNTGTCVPDPRPTVQILAPVSGATLQWGLALPISAIARDPLDGVLPTSSLRFTLDGSPVTPNPSGSLPPPAPGSHVLAVTATDSQGLSPATPASVSFTVAVHAPTVHIDAPINGASVAQDATVSLRGGASDAGLGGLPSSALVWTIRRADGTVVDTRTGTSVPYRFPSQGDFTVTLTANNGAPGGAGIASASVTVHVTAPTGALSVVVTQPADNSWFTDGFMTALTFTAVASDATGTRSDATFVWTDDLDGGLGTGATISHTLSGGFAQVNTHHVTVTATTPDMRSATDTITVLSGQIG